MSARNLLAAIGVVFGTTCVCIAQPQPYSCGSASAGTPTISSVDCSNSIPGTQFQLIANWTTYCTQAPIFGGVTQSLQGGSMSGSGTGQCGVPPIMGSGNPDCRPVFTVQTSSDIKTVTAKVQIGSFYGPLGSYGLGPCVHGPVSDAGGSYTCNATCGQCGLGVDQCSTSCTVGYQCDVGCCVPGSPSCSESNGDSCGECGTIQCDGSCYDPGCGDDPGDGGGPCEDLNPGGGAEWYCGDQLCDEAGCDLSGCDCFELFDPITIDLDGLMYQMTNPQNGVKFDFFNKGMLNSMAWTAKGWNGGFLALDRNKNGKIDSGSELFGNTTPQPTVKGKKPNGFLALAELDKPENGGNGDGEIDAHDAVYSKLVVWIDKNHNGISEPGELVSLKDAGVESISLKYVTSKWVDAYGNTFRYRAQIRRTQSHGVDWTYDIVLGATGKPTAPAKN